MKKRAAAALLACVLLCGCGAQRTEPLTQETADKSGAAVAYVPLDDRPDNVGRVQYLAQSMGYQLLMPEADAYQTKLNGQPLNANGTQYGDRAALYEWVLEQEEQGCDRYILSMDQLLSGGLVNSRSMAESEPVTLSDGSVLTEAQLQVELLKTLASDGENRVWLLDSVMRLAPTVGYDHWDLDGYNALRSYGMEPRPDLAGDALNAAEIKRTYRLNAAGETLRAADFGLSEEEIAEYLSARSRKLELSMQLEELMGQEGYENFRLLMGIDDSSARECIQKNEIAALRRGLRKGDALLSGVDDLAFKALAKLYLEETNWGGATARVRYIGGTESQPACAYDFQPLTAVMEDHLAFFSLRQEAEADMEIVVLTQPAEESQRNAYIKQLVQTLRQCEEDAQPVIFIDASNGKFPQTLYDTLTEEVQLGMLLSYAGFLDMAIVTGTALSHGVARYAALENGGVTEQANRAFARTVADSVLKDFAYKHVVRDSLLGYIRGELGANADNFWQPDTDRAAILQRLETEMDAATERVIRNLEQSNLITSLEPYELCGWGGIELAEYCFPWDRAFEIDMEIRLGGFTQPHRQVLGVYYQ